MIVTVLLVLLIMNIEITVLNILHIKLALGEFTYRYCALSFQVSIVMSIEMVILWVVYTMQSCRWVVTLRRNILSLSSG